jgi:integrase/recombinase XerD
MRILSPEEKQKLFDLDLGIRNNTIIKMLYYTGVRVSELCGLIVDDVYFSAEVKSFISIRAETCKTATARNIQLAPNLIAVLKDYYKWLYSLNNQMPGAGMPVFFAAGRPEDHMSARQVQHIISDAGAKVGIPDLHPHMFRHTVLTDLHRKGVGIVTIQQFAGHKSLQSTQVYVHPSSEDMREGVNKL